MNFLATKVKEVMKKLVIALVAVPWIAICEPAKALIAVDEAQPSITKCDEKDHGPVPTSRFNIDNAVPKEAFWKNIPGKVIITSKIDAFGNVSESKLVASNPLYEGKSVMDEANNRKFKPARKNCVNTEGEYVYTVMFTYN